MNKIYRLKWNRSRNCWCVCSELGSRIKGKKARAVLISAIGLYSSLAFSADVTVNQDKTIDFGKADQNIDYRITVTDNANLVIDVTDTSRPRFTLNSGGGLDITGGKVYINGQLDVLLKGTGFLNVSNAGSNCMLMISMTQTLAPGTIAAILMSPTAAKFMLMAPVV